MFMVGTTQQIRDGAMYFRQQGTGPRTLILLHSVGASSRAWERVADRLAGRDTLYALDMMGHGHSEKPMRGYSIPDYARSVLQFVEARSISQAVFIGNSIGAVIAAEIAANFPRRARAVALVGCPAWESEAERLERLKLSEAFFDERGWPRPYRLEDLAQSYFSPTPELLKWVNEERAKAGPWVKKALEAVCRYDILPTLDNIRCPTLIVNGKQDLLRDKERVLLERIQGSRLAVVPEAGHLPQMDNPQGFLEAVTPFLDTVL